MLRMRLYPTHIIIIKAFNAFFKIPSFLKNDRKEFSLHTFENENTVLTLFTGKR
jgi:hypothetical protein